MVDPLLVRLFDQPCPNLLRDALFISICTCILVQIFSKEDSSSSICPQNLRDLSERVRALQACDNSALVQPYGGYSVHSPVGLYTLTREFLFGLSEKSNLLSGVLEENSWWRMKKLLEKMDEAGTTMEVLS